MARIEIRGSDLLVRLNLFEKFSSLRGNIRVPLASVTSVEVVDNALKAVRGVRAPGYGMPFVSKVGTFRGRDGKTFAVAHRWRRAVRIVLDGQGYKELVISAGDPEATVARIRAGNGKRKA